MKILEVEKFKGSTYCVIFSDEKRIYIDSEIVSQYNLKPGIDIPERAVEEIVTANDTRRAKERALYLLSSKDFSYAELFKRLENNYAEEICYDVCNKMAQLGFINDRRYAQKLARKLFEVKCVGMHKAKQEMRLKGLPDEVIAEAVEKYEDGTAERLSELIDKKYARYLADEKGIEKVKAALIRMGYSYSDIKAALNTYDEDEI
jgi:regulatory protein